MLDPVRANSAILPIKGEKLRMTRRGRVVLDVDEVSFGEPGITVILGSNGAGKSLLLRCLTGLEMPDQGSVSWAGNGPDREDYRYLGLIQQKPVLLRRTAIANLEFALRSVGITGSDAARTASLALEAAGLSAIADTQARRLSGGEQQRLALARALCLKPDILFLDEPTSSLDPASTLAIEQTVSLAAKSGMPVIFVTHDLMQARRIADQIYFMHDGKIIEKSEAASFFEKPETKSAQAFLEGKIPT